VEQENINMSPKEHNSGTIVATIEEDLSSSIEEESYQAWDGKKLEAGISIKNFAHPSCILCTIKILSTPTLAPGMLQSNIPQGDETTCEMMNSSPLEGDIHNTLSRDVALVTPNPMDNVLVDLA
jgi:hypothetical protein